MGALFGFSGPPDPQLLQSMARVLAHRGRGRSMQAVTAHGSVMCAAAHPSDEPFAPHAPACCLQSGLVQEGNQSLALVGVLTALPAQTRTLADLLQRYREKGPRFVSEIRGAFILVVIDDATIHIARDGAGVRTAYWGIHADRLLFAIEPKGVLVAPGFPRRIRPASLVQYLTFSFVPGAPTMLEDLFEIPAGHVLTYDGRSSPRLERTFVFEDDADPTDIPEKEWIERFRALHASAVRVRLPPREPVAVLLSGGLDSSVVTAEVAMQHDGPVSTYSIHFGSAYPHELDFARAVAQRYRTDHHEVLVRPKDFVPKLRRIIWHLDDPIGDPITVPNFELAARVARDTRWVFNGEGGDPCFGGPKNIPMMLHHWYGGIDREKGFRERMYLASYRRGYEEWPRLLTPEWRKQVEPVRDLEGLLTPYFECDVPRSFLNKLCAINIRLKGAHLILPKVDRMMGAAGVVPLAPLFDERLVRLSFEMPPRLKLNAGIEKVVIKRAYQDLLPEQVIARPKSGMRVPVHFWFQGELKRYARKILGKRALRRAGIFDEKRVKQLLDYDTEEGPGRYGLRLWMLLTFEIWRRIVVENEPL